MLERGPPFPTPSHSPPRPLVTTRPLLLCEVRLRRLPGRLECAALVLCHTCFLLHDPHAHKWPDFLWSVAEEHALHRGCGHHVLLAACPLVMMRVSESVQVSVCECVSVG